MDKTLVLVGRYLAAMCIDLTEASLDKSPIKTMTLLPSTLPKFGEEFEHVKTSYVTDSSKWRIELIATRMGLIVDATGSTTNITGPLSRLQCVDYLTAWAYKMATAWRHTSEEYDDFFRQCFSG